MLGTAGEFVNPLRTNTVIIHRALASLGALAIAFAAYFTRELLSEKVQRKWLHSRALAESAKAESLLFRLGVARYDEGDAVEKLLATIESQQKLASGITHDVISEKAKSERLPVGPLSVADYVKDRVDDQIGFYDERTTRYMGNLKLSRILTLALGCVSVLLSVVALGNVGTQVIPLTSTLMAALASYVVAAQYGYLITSYQATGDRLRQLKTEWSLSKDPQSFEAINQLVRGCENAMSTENAAWLAKLSEKVPLDSPRQAREQQNAPNARNSEPTQQ